MITHNQIPHSRCIPPPSGTAGFDNAGFGVKIEADRMNTQFTRRIGVLAALILAGLFVGCQPGPKVVASNTQIAPTPGATNQLPANTTNSPTATSAATNTQLAAIAPAGGTNTAPVIAPPVPPPNVTLGESTMEVLKMAQGGLSDTVLISYVRRTTQPFDLSSEDILYLSDLGISSDVIAAMLSHDGAPGNEPAPPVAQANLVTAPAPQQSAPAPGPTPAPQQATPSPVAPAPADANAAAAPAQQYQTVYQVQPPAQVIQAMPPEQQVTYQYFYSSLAPYGSWVTVDGYGLCWQPSVATIGVGWQPYLNSGRWYNSEYGWYWHSDYSWGWAPFHYGRWARHGGYGWVWIPDTTWGPAWVDWRYNDAYCGWAPLPPSAHWRVGVGFSHVGGRGSVGIGFGLGWDSYVVVGLGNLCGRRPVDHVIGRSHAQNFYNNSTTVNINGNNNNVYINSGVPLSKVAGSTRGEVPRLSVRETPGSTTTIRPEKLSREGNTLVVHRPTGPAVHTQASDIVTRAEAAPLNRPTSAAPGGGGRTVAPASGLVSGGATAPAARQEIVRPTLPTALRPQQARTEVQPGVPTRGAEPIARTAPPANFSPATRAPNNTVVPNVPSARTGVAVGAAPRQEVPGRAEAPARATAPTYRNNAPIRSTPETAAPQPAPTVRQPATVYRSEPVTRQTPPAAANPPTVYRTEQPAQRNFAPAPTPAPVYRAPVQSAPAPAPVYRAPAPAPAPAPVDRAPAPAPAPVYRAPAAPAPSQPQGQAPARSAPVTPNNVHREGR